MGTINRFSFVAFVIFLVSSVCCCCYRNFNTVISQAAKRRGLSGLKQSMNYQSLKERWRMPGRSYLRSV